MISSDISLNSDKFMLQHKFLDGIKEKRYAVILFDGLYRLYFVDNSRQIREIVTKDFVYLQENILRFDGTVDFTIGNAFIKDNQIHLCVIDKNKRDISILKIIDDDVFVEENDILTDFDNDVLIDAKIYKRNDEYFFCYLTYDEDEDANKIRFLWLNRESKEYTRLFDIGPLVVLKKEYTYFSICGDFEHDVIFYGNEKTTKFLLVDLLMEKCTYKLFFNSDFAERSRIFNVVPFGTEDGSTAFLSLIDGSSSTIMLMPKIIKLVHENIVQKPPRFIKKCLKPQLNYQISERVSNYCAFKMKFAANDYFAINDGENDLRLVYDGKFLHMKINDRVMKVESQSEIAMVFAIIDNGILNLFINRGIKTYSGIVENEGKDYKITAIKLNEFSYMELVKDVL